MSDPQESDEAIVEKVQAGDIEQYGVLIDRYDAKLKRYATKFLIFDDLRIDLIMDIFAKAYINIHSFDTKLRFSPWLYRIAHNEFVNEIKRRKAYQAHSFDLDVMLPFITAAEQTDAFALETELREDVDTHLHQLPLKYREPLILHYLEHMSYKEISDVLQIPVTTVGVRINRGKQKLQAEYKKKRS